MNYGRHDCSFVGSFCNAELKRLSNDLVLLVLGSRRIRAAWVVRGCKVEGESYVRLDVDTDLG